MSVVDSHGLNSSYMFSTGSKNSKYSMPNKLSLVFVIAIITAGLILFIISYRYFSSTNSRDLNSSNNVPSKINVSSDMPKTGGASSSSSSASVNVNGQHVELSNPTNYSQTFSSANGSSVNVSISDHQSSSGSGTNQSSSSVSVNTN